MHRPGYSRSAIRENRQRSLEGNGANLIGQPKDFSSSAESGRFFKIHPVLDWYLVRGKSEGSALMLLGQMPKRATVKGRRTSSRFEAYDGMALDTVAKSSNWRSESKTLGRIRGGGSAVLPYPTPPNAGSGSSAFSSSEPRAPRAPRFLYYWYSYPCRPKYWLSKPG